MKPIRIYQTLENRGNIPEVEQHGPYRCTSLDENGQPKSEGLLPWLDEGYYFWDTRITDAHWWGQVAYQNKKKLYIIGQSSYDAHSERCLDLVGDVQASEVFRQAALRLDGKKRPQDRISVPLVIRYLRSTPPGKHIDAVRACPISIKGNLSPENTATYPGEKYVWSPLKKVQICFYDLSLLIEPFKVIYPKPMPSNFTI